MASSFFDQPILNSPYEPPTRHHALDADGQPLDVPPVNGRRRSELITPVPKPRKKQPKADQASFVSHRGAGTFHRAQEYDVSDFINEIRGHVETWRAIPNPADWGVTPATQRLLTHWRQHAIPRHPPVLLPGRSGRDRHLVDRSRPPRAPLRPAFGSTCEAANEQSNPELLRIALKMATGSGKTTVMAMLIAWQTVNAVRTPGSNLYSRGFLVVTPGITIKDRLRVLQPNDPESYYRAPRPGPDRHAAGHRPAKIVITNYHAFKPRETLEISKTGRSLLQGRDAPPDTTENDGQMLRRVANDLLGIKGIVVLNDEAHHCYREKPDSDEELGADERDEAKKNSEAARLWIAGLEAVKRKLGITALYDLSATPFFLRGSGYREGTLFPWTVSDFSLMDAIECGIVKLPRIPVSDNCRNGDGPDLSQPVGPYRQEDAEARAGQGRQGQPARTCRTNYRPRSMPSTATTRRHSRNGRAPASTTPPVFIVVCNNTSTSELVYEWISGFERDGEDEQARASPTAT